VALGVPGRLRPRNFSTFGTTRVVGRQPNAPAAFTPGEIPGTHFQRLSRPQGTWFCQKEPRKKSKITPPGIDPETVRVVVGNVNVITYNSSTWHTVGLYWVPGHVGVQGNEITDKFTRGSSAQMFVGPELSLGVSRQDMRNKIKHWVDMQHLAMWCGPGSTQRQARELIVGPSLTTRSRLLSFNRHSPGLLLAF
jgi:hypothetical protein